MSFPGLHASGMCCPLEQGRTDVGLSLSWFPFSADRRSDVGAGGEGMERTATRQKAQKT